MPLRRTLVSVVMLVAAVPLASRGGDAAPANALTIYSTATPGAIPAELYRPTGGATRYNRNVPGYAVVRQERPVTLAHARDTVRFTDVAALIDPTTVSFTSLTDPSTRVLEQNYQFDLVSTEKLLDRYLDHKITVEQVLGDKPVSVTGTLLSAAGGLVLRDDKGNVQILRNYSNLRFPELPGGLITRPTLVWDLAAKHAGEQRVRVSYQTGGMTWWADYNLLYSEGADANSCRLDVGAWVSIINQSGAGYPDARLKLIAGDVHRATPPGRVASDRVYAMAAGKQEAGGFQEKSFFEYHLYTLPRLTSLPDNSTKQIELFPGAHGVRCHKELVYYGRPPGYAGLLPNPATDRNYGTQTNKKVDIYLTFKNDKKNGLGVPLPSGRVRVSKRDSADGNLEFIGEDTIDHTPKDETVRVNLGSAFDVVGERKQLNFRVDSVHRWMEEEIEIKLRNHKDVPVEVIAKENLYRWSNWKITTSTHKYRKTDARTIEFPLDIPKDGESTARYTVRYSW